MAATGNNPASAFPTAPPRFFDRGNGAKLLQPANQAPLVATVVTTTPALTSYGFTLAQATAMIALVNAMQAALISAGIMSAT